MVPIILALSGASPRPLRTTLRGLAEERVLIGTSLLHHLASTATGPLRLQGTWKIQVQLLIYCLDNDYMGDGQ